MPTVTGRRLIAFNAQYGWPDELQSTDQVQLPAATLTGPLNANGQVVTGLPAPTNPSDACTKGYTDGIAQGISAVASVRALSATNVASLSGVQTIDGLSVPAGGRVLLTGQTNGAQNGVWIVQSGAWTRPTQSPDYLTGTSAAGRFCFVEGGTTYAKQGWVCTNMPGNNTDIVDSNPLTFTQFSGLGEVTAGNGLTASMNTISILLATNPGLQFTNGALDHLLQPYGSLTKNADGLGIQVANTTLATTTTGLKVLGLPALFTVAGTATDANVTAANLNTLNDGNASLADALHSHLSVKRAQAIVDTHTNGSTALSAGDPVYWSTTASTLARGDATIQASSGIIGVAIASIAASASGGVCKRGIVPGVLTGATPGGQVFLAAGGGLTQTRPILPGANLVQVGYAVSATDLEVQPLNIGRLALS